MFAAVDVAPVKGHFDVPKSVVELDRAVRLKAVVGLYVGKAVFDLSNETAASQPDECTLLDTLTAQTVRGNINGR